MKWWSRVLEGSTFVLSWMNHQFRSQVLDRGALAARILILALTGAFVPAVAESPFGAIWPALPADAIAVHLCAGPAEDDSGGIVRPAAEMAAALADRAARIGLLSHTGDKIRAWTDALVSGVAVFQHPHALVLQDVQARPREDGGHELARLHAALLIRTDDDAWVQARIQRLLNTYTNNEESTLTARNLNGYNFVELRDRRLPGWATIAWGRVGPLYAVTIGEGMFDHLIDTIGARDRPSSEARSPDWAAPVLSDDRVRHIFWLFRVDFARLRAVSVPSLLIPLEKVTQSLGLEGVDGAVLTLGRDGPAAQAYAWLTRKNEVERVALCGPELRAGLPENVIPSEASRYAVIAWKPREVARRVADAYLAVRSPGARERIGRAWRQFQTEAEVDFERDVFGLLGERVVIHDYPRYPMPFPLARSVVIPIRDNPERLRGNLDRLFSATANQLKDTNWNWLTLHRADDGVWYVQLGLLGPGVTVSQNWLILSYSPHAVRQVAHRLEQGSAPAVTQPAVESPPVTAKSEE